MDYDKEIQNLQKEVKNLKETVIWLSQHVANNNTWIAKNNGEIKDVHEAIDNMEYYKKKIGDLLHL